MIERSNRLVGLALLVSVAPCFAQVDATQAVKTLKAAPVEVKAMPGAAAMTDLSFQTFLNDFAGKSFTTDVKMQYPFLFKKAYYDDRKFLNVGTVRITTDVYQDKLCVTSTILQYGITRKGCIDPHGKGYTIFRGYALWGVPPNNEFVWLTHNSILVDVVYNSSSYIYSYDKSEITDEAIAVSMAGATIFRPKAVLINDPEGAYPMFTTYSGSCLVISREEMNAGKAARVVSACGRPG